MAAAIVGLLFLRRIENIRKPNRVTGALESIFSRQRKSQRLESDAAPIRVSNGPISNGSAILVAPALKVRQETGAGASVGFPMLMDMYLLRQFFYYFVVLLAGFVLIFDAFTLFDLLGDISKNHIPVSMVSNYFRYLVQLMVYQLS